MARRNRPRNFSQPRDPAARPGTSTQPATVGGETMATEESTTEDRPEETDEAGKPDELAAEDMAPDSPVNDPAAVEPTTAEATTAAEEPTMAETTTVPDAPEPMPPRPIWRTIAIAKQARQVYFGGVLTQILGGELIEYPPHVAALRGDSAFEFIDVATPQELDGIRERHDRAIAALRDLARELGFVVYRDGEIPRSK